MLSLKREAAYQFIAAACGILSVLALIPSVGVGFIWVMLFDSPGSEKNASLWLTAYLYMATPLVVALTIARSLICFREPSNRNMLFLITPLAIWAFAAITIIALIT